MNVDTIPCDVHPKQNTKNMGIRILFFKLDLLINAMTTGDPENEQAVYYLHLV